jgi:hypothetical protein
MMLFTENSKNQLGTYALNSAYLEDPNNLFQLTIEELSESEYDYSIIPLIEVEYEPKEIIYNIELLFNENISID